MNISSLQSRVRTLRRKMALPYAQLIIQRMTDEICDQWACANGLNAPFPAPANSCARSPIRASFSAPSPQQSVTWSIATIIGSSPFRTISSAYSSLGPPIATP